MSRRWWDRKGIDWETSKARVTETDSESGTDTEEDDARSTASGVSVSSGAEWSRASVKHWGVKQPS